MMPSPCGSPTPLSSVYLLILLFSLASLISSGPSSYIADRQVQILDNLTGTSFHFWSNPNVSGRSADSMPSATRDKRSLSRNIPVKPRPETRQALPGQLLDFMGRQRKFKGRTRKSSKCFGLKVDLFGTLSGVTC